MNSITDRFNQKYLLNIRKKVSQVTASRSHELRRVVRPKRTDTWSPTQSQAVGC